MFHARQFGGIDFGTQRIDQYFDGTLSIRRQRPGEGGGNVPGPWRQFKRGVSIQSRGKEPVPIEIAIDAGDRVADPFWDVGSEGILQWLGHEALVEKQESVPSFEVAIPFQIEHCLNRRLRFGGAQFLPGPALCEGDEVSVARGGLIPLEQ